MERLAFALVLLVVAVWLCLAVEGAPAIALPDVEKDPRFFPFAIPLELELKGVANVSQWLDRPAGRHGFVRIEDGRLVDGRGRRLRLLGMNVCFSMDFPLKEEAEQTARRLSALGVNCVRFHHTDMQSEPGGIWDRKYEDSRHLSAEMLDRLDYFVHQLKENGIYSDLNLRVMRQYKAADGFAEPRPGTDKGVDNCLPGMIELQKQYARMLLTHRNPYTGNRYVDEPAVALVEVNNENSLHALWNENSIFSMLTGEGLSKLPARYIEPLEERWNGWLRERYRSAQDLRAAWDGGAKQVSEEQLSAGDVPILCRPLTEYGAGALRDAGQFLCEVSAGYYAEMQRYLKEDLGLKAPVIGTQMRFGSPIDQSAMDVVDVHSYWHHPVFLGQPWQEPWVVGQEALVNNPVGAMEVFAVGLEGRPFVCSEYCHPFPNVYAAEQAPLTAAYGAFQDMDGLIYFSWSHSREALRDTTISPFFDHHAHVAKLVTLPSASALFVRGDVSPARKSMSYTLSEDQLKPLLGTQDVYTLFVRDDVERAKDAYLSRPEAAGLRQVVEASGIQVLPPSPFGLEPKAILLRGLRMRLGQRLDKPVVAMPTDNVYVSDTGQLRWDASEPGRGYFTVNTDRAKCAVGFIAGRRIELGPLAVLVGETFLDGFAVVTFVAVESEIGQPGFKGLLSLVGHVQNRGQQWKDAEKTSLRSVGQGPPLAEGIRAEVWLRGVKGLRVWALDPGGVRKQELEVQEADGAARFGTGPGYRTLWYEIAAQ